MDTVVYSLTTGLDTVVFRCVRLLVVVNISEIFFLTRHKCDVLCRKICVHSPAKQAYGRVTVRADLHKVLPVDDGVSRCLDRSTATCYGKINK